MPFPVETLHLPRLPAASLAPPLIPPTAASLTPPLPRDSRVAGARGTLAHSSPSAPGGPPNRPLARRIRRLLPLPPAGRPLARRGLRRLPCPRWSDRRFPPRGHAPLPPPPAVELAASSRGPLPPPHAPSPPPPTALRCRLHGREGGAGAVPRAEHGHDEAVKARQASVPAQPA